MTNRKLTERLNAELDSIGMPEHMTERVQACSKMFHVPRFKVEAMLFGRANIDSTVVNKVASELDVSADWLLGTADTKKH